MTKEGYALLHHLKSQSLRTLSLGLVVSLGALGSASVSQAADAKPYTETDLKALAKSKSYKEMYSHLKDIPPAKRGASWTKLAETAASGLLADVKDGNKRALMMDGIFQSYPALAESKKLLAMVNFSEMGAFEDCFKNAYDPKYCLEELSPYASRHGKDAGVQLKAARMTTKMVDTKVPLGYYLASIKMGNKAKTCKDSRLAKSLGYGFVDKDAKTVKLAQEIAGKHCWNEVKDDVLKGLKPSDKVFMQNVCPLALEKKALSGVKAKKCKRVVKK